MRISELRQDYSTRDLPASSTAREVARDYVPAAAATQALTRRSYANGLALTETGTPRQQERGGGGQLSELVQVVF